MGGLDIPPYGPFNPAPFYASPGGSPYSRLRGLGESLMQSPTLSGPAAPFETMGPPELVGPPAAPGAGSAAVLAAGITNKVGGAAAGAGFLGTVAPMLAAAGIAMQAAGAYSQAKTQKINLETQALNLDMRSQLNILNAQSLELQAERVMQSSRRSLGGLGIRRADERGRMIATQAARGGQVGSGSIAEATASFDYGALLERYTVNANAVAQREAISMQGLQLRHQSQMDELSALGARTTAAAINPSIAAIAAGLQGGAQAALMFI
jgi:hypothetical protein